MGFVRGLLRDPKRIRAGIDRLIEEERTDAERDPGGTRSSGRGR